jgi:AcrR family transcriptional regulator
MNTAPAFRRLNAEDTLLPPSNSAPRGSRDLILACALRLFAERGYGSTSVRDIASASQVQPATLYAHFPSKEHVLAELIHIGHEEHYVRVRAALLSCSPDPKQQIAALVRAHVGMHVAYPTLTVVANAELHVLSGAFAQGSIALRKQAEQTFFDVIQRGIAKGVFHVPHPWLAMAAIAGAGLRVAHWYTPDFELSPEQTAEVYVELAWRILGVRK